MSSVSCDVASYWVGARHQFDYNAQHGARMKHKCWMCYCHNSGFTQVRLTEYITLLCNECVHIILALARGRYHIAVRQAVRDVPESSLELT